MSRIRVGLAGWSNPPSERAARPPAQSHLAHYAEYFSSVEIDSSFYKPHRAATYERWRDETPAGFGFSIKMPRSITHDSGLRRAAADIARFYEEISHLQPKLKAVLVQLPPSLEFEARVARAFFRSVTTLPGTAVACEPRHASWFSSTARAALRRREVSLVAADPARIAGADVPGVARGFAYFRWHGSPRLYYSKYSDAQLATFAREVQRTDAKSTWCIFDNTARYEAWDDALRFLAILRGTARSL